MKKYYNSEAKKIGTGFTSKSVDGVKLKKVENLNDVFYIQVLDPNSRYAFHDIVYYRENERDADYDSLTEAMNTAQVIHEKVLG